MVGEWGPGRRPEAGSVDLRRTEDDLQDQGERFAVMWAQITSTVLE